MSKFKSSAVGRILRPRSFVLVPDEWFDPRMIREDSAGRWRWFGPRQHPEIANLVSGHEVLMSAKVLRGANDDVSERVEALLLHACEYYTWWFAQMDPHYLLPDSPVRPEPEAVTQLVPSWSAFHDVLGAIHRGRSWLERIEKHNGIVHLTANEIWAKEFGVSVSEIGDA